MAGQYDSQIAEIKRLDSTNSLLKSNPIYQGLLQKSNIREVAEAIASVNAR